MPPSEFIGMPDLLGTLAFNPRTGVLIALLLVAAVIDVRTGRIPNWLVFGGALYALAYNALFPLSREVGILFALGGLAVSGCAFLPLYLLRVMGAGDVKLMAMVGAFIGASASLGAVLATLLTGGVLAIALALWSGRLVHMLRNVTMVFRGSLLTFASGLGGLTVHGGESAGKMPYGLAIAVGTIGYLISTQLRPVLG